MYIYLHIHIYINIYIHLHTCAYIYIYMYIYTCIYICIYMYTYINIHMTPSSRSFLACLLLPLVSGQILNNFELVQIHVSDPIYSKCTFFEIHVFHTLEVILDNFHARELSGESRHGTLYHAWG